MTTIYDALSKDHRYFEQQLDRLVSASKSGSDDWKDALDALRTELIPHAHAEEAVLYNALRELDTEKKLVMHSYGEHATAETMVRTLGGAKLIDANLTVLVEKLNEDLRHHIEEEESDVYAAARKLFSNEEAEQLGAAFEKLKAHMHDDGDSMMASTLDLVANILPPRFSKGFRKGLESLRKAG